MKKTIRIVGGVALSLLTISVNAQTEPQSSQPVKSWEAKKNPTVDSITSQYAGKYIAPRPALTSADIFPVIGKYESSATTDIASVTISLDGQSKGIVWIEGLPQGKVKAMLRKSPATYKIPAQKTDNGKEVAEGTLIFDKETNTVSICIGKLYDAANPSLAFAAPVEKPVITTVKTSKIKKATVPKAWIYTATKLVTETAAN